MPLLIILLVWLMIFPVNLWAATYYIDFVGGSDSNNGTSTSTPWKRVKGMTGVTGTAASASLVGGDTIIFKGGATWTSSALPWTMVGGSASMITYTTDHTWFTGGAWSKPTFDNGARGRAYLSDAPFVTTTGTKFITINDLFITRCGELGTIIGDTNAGCMYFPEGSNITVTNNKIEGRTWIAIVILINSSGNYPNINVTGNEFYRTGSALWVGIGVTNAHVTTVNFTYNAVHDGYEMLGCSVALGMICGPGDGIHGDGFFHYFSFPSGYADPTNYLDGLTLCNNSYYGNWTRGIGDDSGQNNTAAFYIEGALKNSLVCNNIFNYDPPTNVALPAPLFEAVINIRDHGNAAAGTTYVVNNTIVAGPTSRAQDNAIMIEGGNHGTYVYENNIIDMGGTCGWSDSSTPSNVTSDYNLYRCPAGFNTWVADGGHSIAGTNTNPLLTTNPGNMRPTASSPAIGVGQDLTSLGFSILNSDYAGTARPSGSHWDMGAFQFAASVTPHTGFSGAAKITGVAGH